MRINNYLSLFHIDKFENINEVWKYCYQRLLPNKLVMVQCKDGMKIILNPFDTGVTPWLIIYDEYEKDMTEAFKSSIKSGMVILDIGANVGYYSIVASNIIGENGKIYSFEPEPYNFSILEKNIENSAHGSIYPINYALSNKNGFAKLYINGENCGAHSLCNEGEISKSDSIEIKIETLDSFCSAMCLERLDVIKMDVQGAEGLIIEGGIATISKFMPIIFMEFSPKSLIKIGTNPLELLELLSSTGYSIKIIDARYEIDLIVSPKFLMDQYKSGKFEEINLHLEKIVQIDHVTN